jgi:hypothetical protein
LNDRTKLTHSAWPRIDRLNEPSRSPDKLSDPHCSTIAPGWYHSMMRRMTGWKMDW